MSLNRLVLQLKPHLRTTMCLCLKNYPAKLSLISWALRCFGGDFLVDISAAAGHWKSCHFLSSGVPTTFIQCCLLGPRLSRDILDKNSNLLLSSWGSGSYNLRTYIFRAWQACTMLKETLPLMMHWCSYVIGGGVFSSPISYPVASHHKHPLFTR